MTNETQTLIIKLTYQVNLETGSAGLEIEYKNRSIERVCTDASVAERKYGSDIASKIQMRIDQIRSASSVEEMIRYHVGGCHLLRGNMKNKYAVHLAEPYRLIFERTNVSIRICIIEVIDYH